MGRRDWFWGGRISPGVVGVKRIKLAMVEAAGDCQVQSQGVDESFFLRLLSCQASNTSKTKWL